MKPGRWSPFGSGVVIGLVGGLLVALLVGILTGNLFDDSSDDPVVQARDVIEGHYFHDPDPKALDDASIAGMVAEIKKRYDDKFSHYFTAEQLKQFEAVTSGRYKGIGLAVTEVPRGLRISDVFPDTPAEAAGLKEGDVIVAVDGKSIAGVASQVSTARIKGPPGTEVDLTVDKAGGGGRQQLTVERADVRQPAVSRARSSTSTASRSRTSCFSTLQRGRPRRAARRRSSACTARAPRA